MSEADKKELTEKASYAIGYKVAQQFTNRGQTIDKDKFIEAFVNQMDGKEPTMNETEMVRAMMGFEQMIIQESLAKNIADGKAFMAENSKVEGVKVTESGIQYKVITEGTGDRPKPTDNVEVHYEGSLLDGRVFDSSFERGQTVKFPLNRVVPGWSEGVQLMNPGSVYEVWIPGHLAYGERGQPRANPPIPPGATLKFKIELVSINPPGAPKPIQPTVE
jgi:FKBP-type peptidyl-prolyl cis-trans isomerase